MSDDITMVYDVDNDNTKKDHREPDPEEKAIVIADSMLPSTLPIIPLTDRPLFPKMMHPVVIVDERYKKAVLESQKAASNYIGLVMVRFDESSPADLPKLPDNFHKVGVVAKILQVSATESEGPLHVMVQAIERFEIVEILSDKPPFRASVKYLYEVEPVIDEEIKAYAVSVINVIKELVELKPLFKEQLSLLMSKIDVYEPGTLADFSSSLTTASGEELQNVLETRDIKARLEQVLVLLKKELEISKLQTQINKRIEERLSTQQREFFMKQQLKEIQKELGISKGDKETEVEKFQKRIEKLELSEEAEERINEEIEKLKVLEPASPEYTVTRAYLDWLTILPWGIYTEDNNDITKANRILDEDHYGLNDVKDRILELISVGILKGNLSGSIILLVGAPGVGKTSIGHSVARSLGRKFFRFSLGGMRDEAEIKGHRRTYIGALPGKFVQTMKTCKTSNPVIMLDEVDKIGASFQGDPASALLEVLDPEQNSDFLDHYLDVRFDLSKVLFICTANQLETIPRPLLDRMEVISLSGYILEEKLEIAKKYLIPKQLKLHGLTGKQVFFSKVVLREIIDGYAREAGVRSLENNIRKILRKCSKKIVETKASKIDIKIDDLENLLGRRMFREEKMYKKPTAGVVMGLAYTSMGGATLYVEATNIASKGPGFKQTGQLGSVMIESSEIAYTYIRSLSSSDNRINNFFDNNLIHLHVPAGATPKDGPSAGITMACAIYSIASGRPIVKNLAMTGELTLSGLVMPIGGVKEKVIASRRAKVKKLIFPAENRKDFEELDDYIKKGITTYFVDTFKDVMEICFP
ncbi:MAG: endopeptidase La [Desulfobacterales bacterium]|nr:endopeptidase La [Desulfobacteraceae bacterium]MBT7696642.1 endopeptidase La [Desulfobacterales bacterium]